MEKPTTTIKLEVYEDVKDDFLALIYLLKSTLTEDEIKASPDNPITIKKGEEKKYLSLLKKLADSIHIESLDSQDTIQLEVSEDDFLNEHSQYTIGGYHDHPLYKPVKTFIDSSRVIPATLNQNRIEELYEYIITSIEGSKPHIKKTDQFFNTASRFDLNGTELPAYLYRLFSIPYLIGTFNIDPNQSLDKLERKDKYYLCGSIYYNLKSFFPELYFKNKLKGKDYQLRLLTGFIVSFQDEFLLNEEQYYDKDDGRDKSFRDYLVDTVTNHIKKGPKRFYEEEE